MHLQWMEPEVSNFNNWCKSIKNVSRIGLYTVLSVNEYTPFEKYNFKQYLNEHKEHFQNVDKTKFNITSV